MKKPVKHIFIYLYAILIMGGFISCRPEPCEDREEPTSIVHFTKTTPRYTGIHALNTDKTWSGTFDEIPNGTYAGWVKDLPVSMVSDTTTYIFTGIGISDTLSFTYTRNVGFESAECGFTITLGNLRALHTVTTFRDVTFRIHNGNNSYNSLPGGATSINDPTNHYQYGNNIYQILIGD